MGAKTSTTPAASKRGAAEQKSARKRSPDESMLRHAEGCPENPERIEWYVQTRPDGSEVRITRCIDCAKGVVAEL